MYNIWAVISLLLATVQSGSDGTRSKEARPLIQKLSMVMVQVRLSTDVPFDIVEVAASNFQEFAEALTSKVGFMTKNAEKVNFVYDLFVERADVRDERAWIQVSAYRIIMRLRLCGIDVTEEDVKKYVRDLAAHAASGDQPRPTVLFRI